MLDRNKLPARVRDRVDAYLEILDLFFELKDPRVGMITINAVEVYIGYLRTKLGPGWIETVRGVGYRLT